MCRIHQIQERENKHPNQIYEMPIQTGRLYMVVVEPIRLETNRDNGERNDSGYHMEKVKAGNGEKSSAKRNWTAHGIAAQTPPFMEHVEPFSQVKYGKKDAENNRRSEPLQARSFLSRLCSRNRAEHRQTAC